MTNVITLHSHRPTGIAAPTSGIARQQAIENALTMALYHVRHPNTTTAMLHKATARANRALSLLKHACADSRHTVGA